MSKKKSTLGKRKFEQTYNSGNHTKPLKGEKFIEWENLEPLLKEIGWIGVQNPLFLKRYDDHQPVWKKVPKKSEPIAYFNLMLTDTLINSFVKESNDNFFKDKKKVTIKEVRQYIGLILVSISLGIQNNNDLFSRGEWAHNYPNKGNTLSKERFKEIHAHLRIDIEHLVSTLQKNFMKHLSPGTFITVGESRIKAKPNSRDLLSYNKDKPEKWAIEYNTLCDTQTRFLLALIPSKQYTGEESLQKLVCSIKREKGKHYHVTADSKFSTFDQIKFLEAHEMTGTLCIRKDCIPSEVWRVGIANGLPKWESRFAFNGCIVAAAYHRNKILRLCTNYYTIKNSSERVKQPERTKILDQYDDTKRALDQFNQLATYKWYDHPHSSMDQTQQLGLILYAINNAYIMYINNVNEPKSHTDFIRSLATELTPK